MVILKKKSNLRHRRTSSIRCAYSLRYRDEGTGKLHSVRNHSFRENIRKWQEKFTKNNIYLGSIRLKRSLVTCISIFFLSFVIKLVPVSLFSPWRR